MRKLLTLFFLCASLKMYAQCTDSLPYMYVDETTVMKRQSHFLKYHKSIIGSDFSFIDIDIDVFKSYLKELKDNKNTGLRIYLAARKNRKSANNIKFVFAPTMQSDNIIHKDFGEYYQLRKNVFSKIRRKRRAEIFCKKYSKNYRKELDEIIYNNINVPNTKSICYDSLLLNNFLDEISSDCYIQELKFIRLELASIAEDEENENLRGKIVILFHLGKFDTNGNRQTFSIKNGDTRKKRVLIDKQFTDGFDTGLPCPPEPNCYGADLHVE